MAWWESNKVYLQIEDDVLPVEPKKGYNLSLSDAEEVEETEAGTKLRLLTRTGIPTISVKFDCDKQMLQAMRGYRKQPYVHVKYFDPDVSGDELAEDLMYVTGYKESMLADTNDGGIWSVSFSLEDLENV